MIRKLLFLILIAGMPSLSSASVSDGRLPSCHSFMWAVFESVKDKKNVEIIDSWKPRMQKAWETKHNKKWEDNDWGVMEFTGHINAMPKGQENKPMQEQLKRCTAKFMAAVKELR